MKKFAIFLLLVFFAIPFSAQKMTEYQFGTPFTMSFPVGYVKVYDLNDVAAAQFTNAVENKYAIVVQTEKDNLNFVQIAFANITDAGNFYFKNIKDGLEDDSFKKQSTPKEISINGYKAVESTIEGTLIDDESETSTQLFYYFAVVETTNNYYQILLWSDLKNKNKNVEEFRKIANTFKEVK